MNCHHYCEDVTVLGNTNIPIFILLDVHRVVFSNTLVSCFVFLLRHFDVYIFHWSTVYLHPFLDAMDSQINSFTVRICNMIFCHFFAWRWTEPN